MKKQTVFLGVALLFVASTFALATRCSIDQDPAAIAGSTGYSVFDTTVSSGEVAFAAFKSADYVTSGGYTPAGGWGEYIYAYEIFNSGRSPEAITAFIVNINAAAQPARIGIDTARGLDSSVLTSAFSFVTDGQYKNAVYRFGNDPLGAEMHSVVLLFTSDIAPGRTSAKVVSDGYSDTISVVAPHVPEPATMVLLGIGAMAFGRKQLS